jgi:hypothetical protein
MKKMVFFLLMLVSIFSLVGCSRDELSDPSIVPTQDTIVPSDPVDTVNEITNLDEYTYISQSISFLITDLKEEVPTVTSIESMRFIYTYVKQNGSVRRYVDYYITYKTSANNDVNYANGIYAVQGSINNPGMSFQDNLIDHNMRYNISLSASENFVDYAGQTMSSIEEAEVIEGVLAQSIISNYWNQAS